LASARQVGALVVTRREHALAEIDRNPARVEEHALAILHDAPAAAKQLHLLRQAVGDRHRPDVVPEVRIVAFGGMVMEDQEVADAIIFQVDDAVELVAIARRDLATGE
jgi:hypothetical protein